MLNNDIKELKNEDFYSILLFVLFKLSNDPEYSSLSRLAYILDRDNLLKFCKMFGGLTIKVPTMEELEILCSGLLLYQKIDIEKQPADKVEESFDFDIYSKNELIGLYRKIRKVIKDYEFAI